MASLDQDKYSSAVSQRDARRLTAGRSRIQPSAASSSRTALSWVRATTPKPASRTLRCSRSALQVQETMQRRGPSHTVCMQMLSEVQSAVWNGCEPGCDGQSCDGQSVDAARLKACHSCLRRLQDNAACDPCLSLSSTTLKREPASRAFLCTDPAWLNPPVLPSVAILVCARPRSSRRDGIRDARAVQPLRPNAAMQPRPC